ncbi:MAG: aminotransferase class V-fold PLP-dependent enzyme [Myxococcales bacterium]|nr:aminotransferase class V-fold PLP-dependent enzyme [Myxococcales bacterium]
MQHPAPALGDRSLFPTLTARAYLHHAGISPLSTPVLTAMSEAAADVAARGSEAFGTWGEQREQLRHTLASLVGGRAEDVGFVSNTAAGLNAVAWSMPFECGDRVLLFDGEYPSNVSPFLRAAERHGIEVELLSLEPFAAPGGADFSELEAALKRGARLVSVSAVQFQSGLCMPLSEIAARCHAAGARLCVDAVQACGAMPIDVEALGVDYLISGSHKWMMGPDGAGFVSIRPDALAELRPAVVGAMSYQGTLDMLMAGPGHLRYDHPPHTEARVFETGMVGTISFAGLGAAAELLGRLTPAAILDHVLEYGDRLETGLQERGFASLRTADRARQSGILAVVPPPGLLAHELVPALAARGIVCGCPNGRLRFAPHWPNGFDEVDAVLEAIDAIRA